MKIVLYSAIVSCVLLASHTLQAQYGTPPDAPASNTASPEAMARRLEKMSQLLDATRRQLEQSQAEIDAMRQELNRLKQPLPQFPSQPSSQPVTASSSSVADSVAQQGEQQEILQAEIKQHEQIKLESESKYPVKVYGLILFNAFSNAGLVDNPDLPTVAFARNPGVSHGSVGASIRQTILGIRATGPHLWGADTAANISTDFFSGLTYSFYGNSTGNFRLRTADASLTWKKDEVHLGVDAPLISPLSPTSYATLGIPGLAWAGNLWTWAPQIRYQHRFSLSESSALQAEGGLLDPSVLGIEESSSYRELSAGELSRRPSVEGRLSYHRTLFGRELAVGGGGHRGRDSFSNNFKISTWAATADWQMPITRRVQLDGEFYRGRGLGSLGGGAYKDVVYGTDRVTGQNRTLGLNALGGWAQFKLHLTSTIETNFAFGTDQAYAHEMRQLVLNTTNYPLESTARTQMVVGNLIYRPKTYLIFSPEYRRIANWQITGPAPTANIFTLSAGYQF